MLLLVIFGPMGFFYFLSKGEYHFKELPHLYEANNGTPESYKKFELIDQNGDVITQDDLKGKFIIVNYMDKECPYKCKIDGKMMKLIVYNELVNAAGFKDAIIITEVADSSAANRKVIEETLDVDGKKWKFVYSKDFSFFNFNLNGSNPYTTIDDKYVGAFESKLYQRSMLLLDKSFRVRGFLDSSGDIEFKRVMEELRLLYKEYSKKKTVL